MMPEPISKHATLVAFEGIDGSGKTTAANLLVERLAARGVGATLHLNRSLKPVREVLDALAREDGYRDRFDMLGPGTAQLMASLLKWRELLDIAPPLGRADHVVVVDRYFYTHLALATAHGTTNGAFLRRLFSVFPVPDVVLFVDVEPAVAAERVRTRGRDLNSLDFLTRLRDGYLSLPEARQFHVVPGDGDPATVLEAAWRLVTPRIRALSSVPSTSRPAR